MLTLALALAAAGLAGCDESPSTSPQDPISSGASTVLAAGDSLGATTTRLPRSFFVDPRFGNDANPGTKQLPFKTLAHALALAVARDTVRLGPLAYSAATNGEKFTNATQQVVVRSGVMILGTPAEDFTSQLVGGSGETGLNLQGGAIVRDVIVRGFSTGVRATQGVQSLKNVILDRNATGLGLSGSARTTLIGGSVFLTPVSGAQVTGADISQQAQLTMNGGTITPGGPNCVREVTGVSLRNSARLTMKNGATLKNVAGVALNMVGTSKALLARSATISSDFSTVPGGCTPLTSVATDDSASLTLRHATIVSVGGTKSIGIFALSRAPLTLDTAALVGHSGVGIFGQGNFTLVARGSIFRGTGINGGAIGIHAVNITKASITITGSTVFDYNIGIRAPSLKLRKSTVTSNQTGVLLTGPTVDLGQTSASDPGKNTIKNNAITGVTFDASVINGGLGRISASGNTWNPGVQDADANGRYLDKPVFDGLDPRANGKNFALPTSRDFLIQL